ASAIVFLYVFRATEEEVSSTRVVKALAVFFVMVVVGGVAGAVVPTPTFTTVTEKLLPASITSNQFIRSLVHPTAASPLAYGGIHRPRIPANTTNEWGSMYAVSLPFAIAAMSILKSKLWKNALLL